MLKLLVVIICTACLPYISEQVPLTCESNEISLTDGPAQDLRVVDGFQRTDRNDPIFVGSNQSLTIIDEGNIISNSYVGVCYSRAAGGCYKSGDNVDECDNFLRGVTALGDNCTSGSCRVLACGTNAGLPRCSFCNYTDSRLNCSFEENDPPQDLPYDGTTDYQTCTASNINGEGVFQYEKNQNATFLYDRESGNLFYGVKRSSSNDQFIIGLASINTMTGELSDKVITRTDSQKMVATGAHFVGTPFTHGDFAYFLFSEPALEVASLSEGQPHEIKTYYSRIARICRDDRGTTVSSTQTVTSYLKQRLKCCIRQGDECSVEFNEIQDFVVSDDSTTIHAIFTNAENPSPMSALCVYNLTMIDETFSSGNFFGANGATSNDRWREKDGTTISPRPGFDCSTPNTGETNFQRDYNLMYDAAEQTNTNPFYLEGDRFSNLEMYMENDQELYIIASDRGCLYKVNMNSPGNETDLGSPCQDPVVNDPIKDLELLPDNKYLITTSSSVYDISNCMELEEPEGDFLGSPNLGNVTARPNSVFEFVIDTTETGSPNITCNGMPVTDDEQAYLVLKKESLDATDNLMLWRILILDECVVTFGGTHLNYIIQPYSKYTTGELDQRCTEWEETNKAYTELNEDGNCGKATNDTPRIFDSMILLDYNQAQNCADCPYNDCTENTCTP